MPNRPNYVILPKGTRITEANYEGAKFFELDQPAAALLGEIWKKNFSINGLFDRGGEAIDFAPELNYVLSPVANFAGGQTGDEAWVAFDQK